MTRRVFFSFHYQRDVSRANVVKNSWLTKDDREDAGFFDASAFERFQRTGDDALKQFLNDQMKTSSVVCVLMGNQTAYRRWVRYELMRGFRDGRGICGIWIYRIENLQGKEDEQGPNPLACLGMKIRNGRGYFKEFDASTQKWVWAQDVSSIGSAEIAYNLNGKTDFTFDDIFAYYAWFGGEGYKNLGDWVQKAANQAGR